MNTEVLTEKRYYTGFIEERCQFATAADLSLPFFHTCRGQVFRKVLESRRLDASHCDEFQENLLYLFYGRPAYRVQGAGTTRDLGQFPVCFILKSSAASDVKRVFPFDSGAFLHNIMSDYCGSFDNKAEAMSALLAYELGQDLNILAKFIALFYGDDSQYLKVAPVLRNDELKGMCFELSRILDLANSQSTQIWDNRAVTSEIQIESSILFDSERIEAVILPTQFISSDDDLQEFFYDQEIAVLTYDAARMKPESATDLIDAKASEYHRSKDTI